MFHRSKKKGALCDACHIASIVIAALAIIMSLIAVVGVYKAHVLSAGLVFGTSSGSLSLLALAINLFLVKKAMVHCMCQVPSKK